MVVSRFRPLIAILALALPLAAPAAGFKDVADVPAVASPLAAKSLLNGLARAGERLVAVGQRGHILFSDDAGKTWKQAQVPVSSDLVAVSFPTATQGWAVGHDGVVLHSLDAGATWTRQLDGRSAGEALQAHYTALAGKNALGKPEEERRLLDDVKRIAGQGAENPFMDVWFSDANTGFIVGSFNLIYRTVDGGKTWEPWFERTDNPNRLHLYAVHGVGKDVYVTGEQGLVMKLDTAAGRFRAVPTPYKGSFFGVTGTDEAVIVHGLRGNAWRITDAGKSWLKIETGLQDGITGAATLGTRGVLLVSQSGLVLVSKDSGEHFSPLKMERATPASAVVVAGKDSIVIAGARGVRAQALQ